MDTCKECGSNLCEECLSCKDFTCMYGTCTCNEPIIKSLETLQDNCPVCGGSRKLESHSKCTGGYYDK